jgi:hypothetical protein
MLAITYNKITKIKVAEWGTPKKKNLVGALHVRVDGPRHNDVPVPLVTHGAVGVGRLHVGVLRASHDELAGNTSVHLSV